MNKEMLLRPLLILFMVIIASVILVRSFTGGQTLTEYAQENNIPAHSQTIEETDTTEK